MPQCYVRYHQATGELYEAAFQPITSGVTVGEATADIGEQAQVPNFRTQRFNGANGVRAATVAEITAYDSAAQQTRERQELDEKKLRALVIWLAGRFGITPAVARQELVTIYRGL